MACRREWRSWRKVSAESFDTRGGGGFFGAGEAAGDGGFAEFFCDAVECAIEAVAFAVVDGGGFEQSQLCVIGAFELVHLNAGEADLFFLADSRQQSNCHT